MDSLDKRRGHNWFPIMASAAIIAFAFYLLTCFRTFTWWDSSEYSLSALILGVPHPPGSLLTVLIGWLVSRLPLSIDKFFLLNLLAAAIAAVTVYLVGLLAITLSFRTGGNESNKYYVLEIGAFLGALTFGFAITTWYYAIRFTPYITTALLTALIIITMLAWQRRSQAANEYLWIGLITLLFGLDFNVHRTNLLILPAFLLWVLLFNPRAYLSIKNWFSGLIGLVLGFSLQLLIIPIAAARPFINFNDPSSLSRLWDYITIKQYGGGWLFNIFPRKAPFLSVQVADYIKVFSDNFANSNMAYLGFIPLIVGITGLVVLFKRNWKLALGLFTLFLSASIGAIIYFNLPANYFRSIDRHYLPSFLIFSIFIAYGSAMLTRIALNLKVRHGIGVMIIAMLLLMPLQAIRGNHHEVDGSKSSFAYDTARNFLANLPAGALFFSQADIDTYPLWCLQQAEGLRPDVTICNLSLLNTPWFITQLQENDKAFPVNLSSEELASLSPIPWHDSTITIPVNLAAISPIDDSDIPAFVNLNVPPSLMGKYLLVQDQVILKIIEAADWRRPLCFSSLIPENSIRWLRPYLRLEGLYRRFLPSQLEIADIKTLRKNLLENYTYRGYSTPSIPKDQPTKWIAWNYCSSFLNLSSIQFQSGDTLGCHNTTSQMQMLFSGDDLSLPPDLKAAMANACK